MTLDRLDRNDAMDVMKMFYELEEQVLIREDNIRTMRYYLRNYHPKKTKFAPPRMSFISISVMCFSLFLFSV